MNDDTVSIKPFLASLAGFATGLFGNFSVDTFSKLCTSLAALVTVAYAIWKWRKDAALLERKEAEQARLDYADKSGGSEA